MHHRSRHRPRSSTRPSQRWIEVREPGTGHLLFKYNAQRHTIEVQRRRQKTVIDLWKLEAGG